MVIYSEIKYKPYMLESVNTNGNQSIYHLINTHVDTPT